jgi:hypothetical protein
MNNTNAADGRGSVIKAVVDRVARTVLVSYARFGWGLSASIMPVIVETLGPFETVRWMLKHLPTYEKSLVALGPVRANLVCMSASLFNGCSYCVYAHARAFELAYFDRYGRLFALDEHDIISLMSLTDSEHIAELERALTDAGLQAEVAMLRRLYALKFDGAGPTADDVYLVNAIQMYDVLNYCAVSQQLGLDDAHDRINRDAALKARYADARLREGRRRPRPDDRV